MAKANTETQTTILRRSFVMRIELGRNSTTSQLQSGSLGPQI
jgi:hypothetical protein